MKLLSRVRLLATPWTAAHQALPSMGFSRQEYWTLANGQEVVKGAQLAKVGRSEEEDKVGSCPYVVVVQSLSCVQHSAPPGLLHQLPCSVPSTRRCSNSCPLSYCVHMSPQVDYEDRIFWGIG